MTTAGHSDATGTVVTREPCSGQLATLTRGAQKLEWTYDGFLMKEEKASGVTPGTSQWRYDSDFRAATRAGSTGLYSEGLSYDATGRLRVVEEAVEGVQWVYGYDVLGRLTSASKNGASPTTWSYDGNGNRVTEGGVGSTYDAQDRLLTQGSTTYSGTGWVDGAPGQRVRR